MFYVFRLERFLDVSDADSSSLEENPPGGAAEIGDTTYTNRCVVNKKTITAFAGPDQRIVSIRLTYDLTVTDPMTGIDVQLPWHPDRVQGGTARADSEPVEGGRIVRVDFDELLEVDHSVELTFEFNRRGESYSGNPRKTYGSMEETYGSLPASLLAKGPGEAEIFRMAVPEICHLEVAACFPVGCTPRTIWFVGWVDAATRTNQCSNASHEEVVDGQPMEVFRESLPSTFGAWGYMWNLDSEG